jgi:hypothetical protein
MIERDYYFAAWAIEQGVSHAVTKGNVDLLVDTSTLYRLRTEYANTHKRCFERVRKIIKEVNQSRI